MPPSIFERLINILGSSPDTHHHWPQEHTHQQDLAAAGAAAVAKVEAQAQEEGEGEEEEEAEVNEDEEESNEASGTGKALGSSDSHQQQQQHTQAHADAHGGKGKNSTHAETTTTTTYFSDQDGRILRGDSRATSLDVCRPPLTLAKPAHVRQISWMTDLGHGPLSLADFAELLPTVLERCNTRNMKKCEPVKRLLNRLELPRSDWEKYAFWDPDKLYTRNLVATDRKTFTLLLLCWNGGKESPIHDHPCEGCWVKSVQGTVKETIYQMDPIQGLIPEKVNYFHPGELSYIEDSLGFHKVGNPDPTLGAVTLHCYIPPPKSARVWLASRTAAEDAMHVPTCLYSAFGKKVENSGGGGGTIMQPVMVVGGAGEVVGSPGTEGMVFGGHDEEGEQEVEGEGVVVEEEGGEGEKKENENVKVKVPM